MPSIVVQKYGGSSLADEEKIKAVAKRIVATKEKGYAPVAVVSAMGKTTDQLLRQAKAITENPSSRELDMLLSVGERITMSLLSLAIQELGYTAVSLTGSQCGIITSDSHSNAKIIDIRPVRVEDEVRRGNIVIVAGFQGMSYRREITTLGRGGSDTTAVALAAALDAQWCEICSDVEGVFTTDPNAVPEARLLSEISYDEMEALGVAGAKVLNPDAVDFARRKGLEVRLTATYKEGQGTLLLARSPIDQQRKVRAITCVPGLLRLSVPAHDIEKQKQLIDLLASWDFPAPFWMVVGGKGRVVLHIDLANVHSWEAKERLLLEAFPDTEVERREGSLSLVGPCLGADTATLSDLLELLKTQEIPYKWVKCLRDSITVGIEAQKVGRAVEKAHARYIESL